MTTIVTRAGKGSPLTNNEVDANFVNLNDAKIETLTSTDTSVTITGTGSSRDLSVPINPDVVSGPASATDNAIARYDATTGKLIQNSVVTVSDTGAIAGATTISDLDYLDFDTTYNTTLGAGQLGWNGNDTLGLGMIGGNVVQHIGEDTFYYVKASATITKGQVIMFTGALGASGVILAAPSTGVTNPNYIMGIAAESIANSAFGLIQAFGVLRSVDTQGFADGDVVYYDSAVTGGYTATYPTSGPIVIVGAVVNGGSNSGGVLQIRVSVTQRMTASTGISVSQNGTGTTITNTAPDQTVVLTAGTGISTSGTYPSFTVTNSAPDQTVALTASTGISVTGTYPNFTIASTVTGASITDDTTTNATRYPLFEDATSGSLTAVNVSSTKFTFNPSTGTLSATVMTASSDERLKENWTDVAPDFIEKFAKVKHGVFTRIDSGNREAGVSAQSFQAVLPEAVVTDEEGYLSVNYGGAALVAAIELAKQVQELRAEIAALKAKVGG